MRFGFSNVVFVVRADDRPRELDVWPACTCPKRLGCTVVDCSKGEADVGVGVSVDDGCPHVLVAAGALAKGFGAASNDG